MTHEEILKLIDKAGFDVELPSVQDGTSLSYKLAKLAIESEREACAKVCEGIAIEARTLWKARYEPHEDGRSDGAFECAEAIRARGSHD